MKQVDTFEVPVYNKLLNLNLLLVKDYAAFQEITSGRYYTTNIQYLNTLYKEVGLKNHSFVKSIYLLDKTFTIKIITDKLKTTKSSIYFNDESGFIVCPAESYNNLQYVMAELNKFEIKYLINYNKYYMNNSYIVIDDNKGLGISIYLPTNEVFVYDVSIKDDIIYIANNTSLRLNDENFRVFFNTIINSYEHNIVDQFYDEDYLNTKLNWIECEEFVKIMNQKDFFTDDDYEVLSNITNLKKQLISSPYTIEDILKLLTKTIYETNLNFYEISKITDKLIKRELITLQL